MGARVLVFALSIMLSAGAPAPERFVDTFDRGLDRWRIVGENAIRLKDSGDPSHGMVMELAPNGDAAAIIKGSEAWGPVRMEGEMLFPSAADNYLGFLYNYTRSGSRQDFGLIYLKGNDNYLQVNPHRDFNVSRLLYPEGRATLTGAAAVTVGHWRPFALEVFGAAAHVYVGDMAVPQLTFDAFEHERGAIGLQPRSVGAPVWVDNLRVRSIDRLSYTGSPRPAVTYDASPLLVSWRVAGPYAASADHLARHPEGAQWASFPVDSRGAIVTGRVADFHGARPVAYFRTTIDSPGGDAEIQFSTIDDLAVWLNGEFQAFVPRQDAAWFDFATNPAHRPVRLPVTLRKGANDLIVKVRGGVYASGGFFSRVAESPRD